MRFDERRTIAAISELRGAYPYAAALLSYVVVERVLKRHILDHWTDQTFAKETIPRWIKRHGAKSLSQLQHLTPKQRLDEVLCEMTLASVEDFLGRPKAERSSPDRNEAMHSNLYLKAESALPRAKQVAKNRTRFETAFRHLKRVLAQYADRTLIERNGRVATQPINRFDLAGGRPRSAVRHQPSDAG